MKEATLTNRAGRQRTDIAKDAQTLTAFVHVFCEQKHETAPKALCSSCHELLAYALQRLEKCPYDPKPKCKDCLTHCYKPDYRTRIQEIMKFSGMYFVKRGRLDWVVKYFL